VASALYTISPVNLLLKSQALPPVEQRRLLRVMIEKATWKGGELQTALFEPFEILRHSNRENYRKQNEIPGSGQDLKIWLPMMNSNTD
jgi:hypothetical protein